MDSSIGHRPCETESLRKCSIGEIIGKQLDFPALDSANQPFITGLDLFFIQFVSVVYVHDAYYMQICINVKRFYAEK